MFAPSRPNDRVKAVVSELIALGLCPVPVVPKQKAKGLKAFTGKVPSYFDEKGKPKLLAHKKLGLYDRLPTEQELEQWFDHPDIGLGSFGSADGLTCWIDFDAKHFESERECRQLVLEWRLKNGISSSWVDQSGGGGYRVLVRFSQKPNFTQFSLNPGGKHVGEILGYGKFCVLAPSQHPSGRRYKREKSGNAGLLTSAESSGLYPVASVTETIVTPVRYSPPKNDSSSWTDSDWARSYLAALKPERADDYESWIKVGIALRSVGDPHLFDDWIKWSRQSSKYQEGECERKWAGFKPGNLTLGTLHYWAVDDGWINPKKENAVSQESNNNQANHDDWAWKNWVESRKFTPDVTIDEKYFKFGELPEKDVIIIGNSGLGTGKTHEVIQQLKISGKGSRTIGFINSLLYQTNERFISSGLSSVYHLHGDDSFGLLSDKNAHISYCLPSIPHTAPSHYEEVDTIIDEAVLVLKSAIEGNTLGDDQGYCLESLALALQHTDRVIALDGNFRDIDAELLEKLAPNKKVIKYWNKYKEDSHNITFIDGIDLEGEVKKKDCSALIKVLLDKDVKPFIVTDSLKRSKILCQILLESGKKVKVLNSETSNEEWAKIFLSNPTKYLEEANLDGMIMSPSGCAGLDVWSESFTHKFTFVSGVLDVNGITQMMFRLRNNIPHFVFCPEKGLIDDSNTPNTYSFKKFQEQLDKYINQSAVLATGGHISSEKIQQKLSETIERSDDKYWEYSAQVGALNKYEKDNLRRCLIWALENSGHKVEVTNWFVDNNITAKTKQVKEELQILESKELYEIEPISYEEAVKKARSGAANKEEIRQIDKAFLLHRLPGIEQSPVFSSEYILKNHIKDTDFISKNERLWMLLNYEVSQKRHEVDWYFHSEKQYFYKGMAKKSHHSKVWALKQLDIEKFFNGRFHKESPEIIELIERGNSPDIILALGFAPDKINPNEKHRIAYLRRLMGLIGIKLSEKGKETIGKQRIRIYEADMSALEILDRKATLEAIERRFSEWMNSDKSKVKWEPEKETVQSTGECPQPPIYYIQGGGADTSSINPESITETISWPIGAGCPQLDLPENISADNGSDIENLAAAMAAAGDFDAVKNLVEQFGFDRCDDALILVPWERRNIVSRLLKSAVFDTRTEEEKDAQEVADMWVSVCSEPDPVAAQEYVQDIYKVMADVVKHYGENFKKLVWGFLDAAQKARIRTLMTFVPHPS